jgi:hypothetical protein
MLARSVPMRAWSAALVVALGGASMLALRTLRGRDSRLPPKREEGARARTEASVSMERRRRRLEDEARVRIEALSVRRLLAVAVL